MPEKSADTGREKQRIGERNRQKLDDPQHKDQIRAGTLRGKMEKCHVGTCHERYTEKTQTGCRCKAEKAGPEGNGFPEIQLRPFPRKKKDEKSGQDIFRKIK